MFEQARCSVEARSRRAHVPRQVAGTVDFDLQSVDAALRPPMPLDNVATRLGIVEPGRPAVGAGDSRRFLRQPRRGATTVPVAQHDLGLAAPLRHGMAVKQQHVTVSCRKVFQLRRDGLVKRSMSLRDSPFKLGPVDRRPPNSPIGDAA